MVDSFTETEHVGFGTNLKNALVGTVFGLILFIASFPILFINEKHAVERSQSLEDGKGSVITVTTDEVKSEHDQKLVHMTGALKTESILKDGKFKIEVNAIHLKRQVEMYQWKEEEKTETRDKVGGGTERKTTYTYKKVWSSQPINSENFRRPEGHENPAFRHGNRNWSSNRVDMGAFQLSENLIGQYDKYTRYDLTQDKFKAMDQQIRDEFKLTKNMLYSGEKPGNPKIGDTRIKFLVAYPGDATVMAMQSGESFAKFPTRGGKDFLEETLAIGHKTSEELFAQKEASHELWTWVRRAGGTFAMFLGLCLLMGPLKTVANILPFLGWLVGGVTGFIAFLVTIILAPLTISIGWIAYRPLIGIPLLGISLVGLFLLIQNRASASKKRKLATA